jgi:hypothetical protein
MGDRALPWQQRSGLECLDDGWFLGWNAGPEKAMVRSGGQPVINDGRPGAFWNGW